jgi:hypothetical protein
VTYQNKIGYIEPSGPFGDAAVLRRRTKKGLNLLYVAVALGGRSHQEIQRAGSALDDCVLLANGEEIWKPADPDARDQP